MQEKHHGHATVNNLYYFQDKESADFRKPLYLLYLFVNLIDGRSWAPHNMVLHIIF